MTPSDTSSANAAVKPSQLAPCKCSWSAHRKIRLFVTAEPAMDTALTLCECSEMRDPAGGVILKLEGDHFELEYHGKGRLPQDSFYFLDGLEIYILPPVVERLRGKRLVTKLYRFGRRYLLTLFSPRYQIEMLKAESLT